MFLQNWHSNTISGVPAYREYLTTFISLLSGFYCWGSLSNGLGTVHIKTCEVYRHIDWWVAVLSQLDTSSRFREHDAGWRNFLGGRTANDYGEFSYKVACYNHASDKWTTRLLFLLKKSLSRKGDIHGTIWKDALFWDLKGFWPTWSL